MSLFDHLEYITHSSNIVQGPVAHSDLTKVKNHYPVDSGWYNQALE